MPSSTSRVLDIKLSKLQMKGIFTLTLFLLSADSASHAVEAAAATEHKNGGGNFFIKTDPFQRSMTNHNHNNNHKLSTECWNRAEGDDTDGTCRTGSSSSNNNNWNEQQQQQQQFVWSKPQKNGLNCESDACFKCFEACTTNPAASPMSSRYVQQIPRGGHSSHAHSAAETAAAVRMPPPFGIPLHLWKVLLQAFLTGLNVFCWYVPLRSKQMTQNEMSLSLANAFSGGVFLSLAFLHLIPECVHGFTAATTTTTTTTWPEATPFALVLAGYLLIFVVEKIAFDAHDILHELQQTGGAEGEGAAATRGNGTDHSHAHATLLNGNNPNKDGDKKLIVKSTSTTTEASLQSNASTGSSGGGRSAMILLGALGIHSILEMMALGLSDSFSDAALLTLSIALHQPAESIALTVAFVKSGLPVPKIVQFLSIFSCMGPIGVAFGMAVNEFAAPIVDSILLAVVAGTFVYVGATEVIPEEFESSVQKWKKFAALMTGIVMILGITQYTVTLGG